MKTIRHLFLLLFLSVGFMLYGQDNTSFQALPYFCGFENPKDTAGTYGWKFEKRAKIKHTFTVGNAVHRMGANAMYVSADSGATAGYAYSTSGSTVVAYKAFKLEAGTYDLVFDYRLQGEDHENSDVMRVAFYSGTKPSAVAMNGFPQYALDNPFKSKDGTEIFKTTLWTQVEGQVVAPADGNYYLVFLFKEDGDKNIYNPGACIDNIQLDKAKTSDDCAEKPKNIKIDKDASGIKLSWDGHADSYEIIYYRMSSIADTTYTLVSGIQSKEYSIPYAVIPEGVYNFRIRSLCSNDTSFWVEKSNYIVYNDSKHCLNYMDFSANGTTCMYGDFADPASRARVVDYGYESRHSIHTVHYMNDEYDRLTGYKLKTVPEGQIASVRLGNWTEGGHGDSPIGGSVSGQIVYTYTIPYDKSVLLLHYAAVLQYAAHHPANMQTRIQVQIKDMKDLTLECASADFNARDVSEGNTRGWQTYQPLEGETLEPTCPIKWLDWSVLGMNLSNYAGQTVKIVLTLNACEADYHFAYGYFALDCTEGEVEGLSCTEKADTLFVPDGFNYLWYVKGDKNKTPVSTERYFVPEENDINSYVVELIYPEDNGCYFTLEANVWPRVPQVDMEYEVNPQNCINYVDITNKSRMVDLKMDEQGNVLDTIEVSSGDAQLKDYYWEIKSNKEGTVFRNGQTVSTEINPRIVAASEGDTFIVVLRGLYNTCEDIREFEIKASAVQPSFGVTDMYICDGKTVEFNGKIYTEPGTYKDTLQSVYGCDSILQLNLRTLLADTIHLDTMICSAETPYFWKGEWLDSTGVYEKGVSSFLGCDSVYYILNLTVFESLELKIDELPEICEDNEFFEINYTVLEGYVSGYSVHFLDNAKNAGFEDFEEEYEIGIGPDSLGKIEINLPKGIKPNNRYGAVLSFYNQNCGDVEYTIEFDVLYSSDIIAQRWNDVLAVKNSDYNGGYEFVAYQWFLNGMPLEGFTTSQYYTGANLDFSGDYQVLLTRKDDGVSVFTCSVVPMEFSQGELENTGVVVFANDVINVETQKAAKCYVYSMSGLLYSVSDLVEGVNIIDMPKEAGIYIMQFNYLDGDVEIRKIVVGKI